MNDDHNFEIGQIVLFAGRVWEVVDAAHQGVYRVKLQIVNFAHCPPMWVDHRAVRLANDDD